MVPLTGILLRMNQIVKESNVIHPPYDDGIFIAPTLDTKIYKNILKMLFQKFEDVIKDTHFLIVIGYSFRDERINNVIHNAIDSGKAYTTFNFTRFRHAQPKSIWHYNKVRCRRRWCCQKT